MNYQVAFLFELGKGGNSMRKRNIQIITRLNRKEQEHLQSMVKRSGLSQEAYVRQLINGVVPNDAPPVDYYKMMQELHSIGNNLNQIAKSLNTYEQVDIHFIEITVNELRNMIKNLEQEVRGV